MKVFVIKVMTILRLFYDCYVSRLLVQNNFCHYKKLVQLNIMVFLKTGNYACGKAIDSVQLISFLDDIFVEVFIPNLWSQLLFFHRLDSLYRIQRWLKCDLEKKAVSPFPILAKEQTQFSFCHISHFFPFSFN